MVQSPSSNRPVPDQPSPLEGVESLGKTELPFLTGHDDAQGSGGDEVRAVQGVGQTIDQPIGQTYERKGELDDPQLPPITAVPMFASMPAGPVAPVDQVGQAGQAGPLGGPELAAPLPLVSVIVPVYNAQEYVRYCVDSILRQSHRNLEVILVDDGATDDSPVILDEYARRDDRVRVIHQENGGIAKAQNAGLDAAHGEYIAFADNDDILDRRNIELLLHALVRTGADMSKARWRQFGVSQLYAVAEEAAAGAKEPERISVFENPLHAYQTVFCKSLRLAGSKLGRNTEARYFNEANWCRLYRRELWDGVRFPEGMYAQDTAVAGELYVRMNKVADIDVNLYNWLQRPESVTHNKRDAAFHHDHVVAAARNFRLCLEHDVHPYRSYYTLLNAVHDERTAPDFQDPSNQAQHEADVAQMRELLSQLPPHHRALCASTRLIRLAEKQVYDARIKNMQ